MITLMGHDRNCEHDMTNELSDGQGCLRIVLNLELERCVAGDARQFVCSAVKCREEEDGHNKFTNVTENSYYGRFSVQKEQTKSFVIFTAQNSTRVLGLPIGGAAKTARQVRQCGGCGVAAVHCTCTARPKLNVRPSHRSAHTQLE